MCRDIALFRIVAMRMMPTFLQWPPARRAAILLFCLVSMLGRGVEAADLPPGRMEPEMRCCFTREEVKNTFWIQTGIYEKPGPHLRLRTPSGALAGFDPVTRKFYPPSAEAIYAGEVPLPIYDMADISASSVFVRKPNMIVKQLLKGEYLLDVIGIHAGKYYLSLTPLGHGVSSGVAGPPYTPIAAGEIHTYAFNGEFTLYAPMTSPTYFRVRRIK